MVNRPREAGRTRAELLDAYLECAPFAVALFRASEAAAITGYVPFDRPILDIGCAFGEFGRLFFSGQPRPEIGLDIDRSELLRERAEPAYETVIQADACQLPAATASLGTVLSVSTLEHVPGVQYAFPEIARALRPHGRLVMTVPIKPFNTNLLGYRALSLVSKSAADNYAGRVHKGLTHINIWPADDWRHLVESAGLQIEHMETLLSPRATKAFELLLPAAFANRIWRQVLGSRPPHPAPLRAVAHRIFTPMIDEASEDGSNLFIVARKGP